MVPWEIYVFIGFLIGFGIGMIFVKWIFISWQRDIEEREVWEDYD